MEQNFINKFVVVSGKAFMTILFIIAVIGLIYGVVMILLQLHPAVMIVLSLAGLVACAVGVGKLFNYILKNNGWK